MVETRGGTTGERAGTSRRAVLAGGAGLVALAGGWYVFLRETGDPAEVAAEFVAELDAGEFGAADDLIHPESPLDGAGDAADLVAAIAGVDGIVEALDLSVVETDVTEESGGEAVVDVRVELDLLVETLTTTIPLEMRTDDGDWFVWNVDT